MLSSMEQRYLSEVGMWHFFIPGGAMMDYEILVRGGPSAPAKDALALLERVLARLDDLTKQATRFLDAFVDRHKFAAGNDWIFTGIQIGRNANDPGSQFWLTFDVDGDTYGEWSVAMNEVRNDCYHPLVLSRRNF